MKNTNIGNMATNNKINQI